MNSELDRIDNNNNGETPQTTMLTIKVKQVQNPELILEKTKEIMKLIASNEYKIKWPADEQWKEILPSWFVQSMTSKSIEEIMKTEGQWHYESWIDNIRMRAWVWWSSKIDGNNLEFVLETLSLPYLYNSFLYILYSQGIPMENITAIDDVYD